jgi:hypothetical protein
MYASDTTTWSAGTRGCATHGSPECLCDVRPLESGVPIRSVPFLERLVSLGGTRDRYALLRWADEVLAFTDSQELSMAAEG